MSVLSWPENERAEITRAQLIEDRNEIIKYLRENGPSLSTDIDDSLRLFRGRASRVAADFSRGYFNIEKTDKDRCQVISLKAGL